MEGEGSPFQGCQKGVSPQAQGSRKGVGLIRGLFRSLLIAAALVPFSLGLPFAAVWLCRTPEGAEFLFWTGPLSAGFLCAVCSALCGSPWRRGAEAVRQWRDARGGLLAANLRATFWMFLGIAGSFAAEFAMLFSIRPSPSGRALLPVFTYSPVALCWVWRHARG